MGPVFFVSKTSAAVYQQRPLAGARRGVAAPPAFGGTLWFRNCDDSGTIDKRSLHAGDTVIAGNKWVVTKWFRERPTSYLSA